MIDKVRCFLLGVCFAVMARYVYYKVLGWWMFRKISEEIACERCKGRKTADALIRGTTSMETEKVACPVCDGSGLKVLRA